MRIFRRASTDNCEGVRELLSPYIDNRTTASERQAVERHLATCADCRKELSQLRSLVGGLRLLPQLVPARTFALRPSDVRAPSAPAFANVFVLRRLAASLAACLVLLFGIGALLPGGYTGAPALAPAASRSAQPMSDTAKGAFTQGAPAPAPTEADALAEKSANQSGATAASVPAAAPAAGAARAPDGTPSLAAAPAPMAAAGTPVPLGTPVPTAPLRATEPSPIPATEARASPVPSPAVVAAAPADRQSTAVATPADDLRRGLWTAQLVVALGLLLALVGGFLGRRRPDQL